MFSGTRNLVAEVFADSSSKLDEAGDATPAGNALRNSRRVTCFILTKRSYNGGQGLSNYQPG
jgi:hypothetical protein